MALPRECSLCGADAAQTTVVTGHVFGAKEGGQAFYHCAACDVRFQHPGLTPEQEARFYAAEFEGFMASRAGAGGGWNNVDAHARANESTRLRRLKYLSPHLAKPSRILEVGCSSGFMLSPMRAAGHDCVGIEPSGVFSEHLRKTGMPVYDSLDALPANERAAGFDLILHFFVLEHIAKPVDFLRAQVDMLRPGGRVIFEIPNAADPLFTVFDIPAFERFYWSVAHPWYFSERSLQHVLDRVGAPAEMLLDQRYDLSNHMIWARDGRPGGMGRFTALLGEKFEEDYKQSLIRIRLCDTLIGIIRKG